MIIIGFIEALFKINVQFSPVFINIFLIVKLIFKMLNPKHLNPTWMTVMSIFLTVIFLMRRKEKKVSVYAKQMCFSGED